MLHIVVVAVAVFVQLSISSVLSAVFYHKYEHDWGDDTGGWSIGAAFFWPFTLLIILFMYLRKRMLNKLINCSNLPQAKVVDRG
jgi:hypothetical protein